jgi:hypothetical protein
MVTAWWRQGEWWWSDEQQGHKVVYSLLIIAKRRKPESSGFFIDSPIMRSRFSSSLFSQKSEANENSLYRHSCVYHIVKAVRF